jgi:hypothetical protein
MERGDRAALLERFAKNGKAWHWYYSPRFFYLTGADLLEQCDFPSLLRQPAWRQRQIVAQLGTIQHPATARIVMWLASGKPARAEAAGWLQAHADFAKPILEKVSGGEATLARAALAAIGGEAPPVKKTKQKWNDGHKDEYAMLRKLEPQLLAAKGARAGEKKVLEEAFASYCEHRAAREELSPGDYFTHALADLKWKTKGETFDRWIDLAVEVADEN